MFKKIIIATIALCLIAPVSYATAQNKSTNDKTNSVATKEAPVLNKKPDAKTLEKYLYKFTKDGKEYTAYVAFFDLNDPTVRVEISMKNDAIASVDLLENLSAPKNENEVVLGAINAAFFDMSASKQSASTLILGGDVSHVANYGSIAGFDGANNLIIDKPMIKLIGSINDQWEKPYLWSAYNINHLYPNYFEHIMIFNSRYSGTLPSGKIKCVVVERNKVSKITEDSFPEIPKYGYVLCAFDKTLLKNFKVGDSVDYKARFFERDDEYKPTDKVLAWSDIKNAVGVGPTLVKDGKYALLKGLENHTLSSYAKRSFLGITADKKLALAVTNEISFDTMCYLALDMGLTDAIALDGGGSSSLIADNILIRGTTRRLSNAIVVKKVQDPIIRVRLNDVELFFDVDPFIHEGRTMLPIRKILEKLGCTVDWNENGDIVVKRYSDELLFKAGSKDVILNGRNYTMDVPVLIKDSRSFISVRFLTEFLGGTVDWIAADRMVELQLPTANSYYTVARALFDRKSYEFALAEFEKVLKMNPEHIGALKYTARIYDEYLRDKRSALIYINKITEILPDEFEHLESAGNIALDIDAKKEAMDYFTKLLATGKNNDAAHYGLGRAYMNFNNVKAKEEFKWVADNAKDSVLRSKALELYKKLSN